MYLVLRFKQRYTPLNELNITVAGRLPSKPRSIKRYGRPLKRRIRNYNLNTVGVHSTSGLKFEKYEYTYKRYYNTPNVFTKTNKFKT